MKNKFIIITPILFLLFSCRPSFQDFSAEESSEGNKSNIVDVRKKRPVMYIVILEYISNNRIITLF